MALTPRQKRQFASEAQLIPALLQVGKNGITRTFIEELERMSKKRGLVKIKFLKSFLESQETSIKEQLEKLAEESKTELVQIIGNTATFFNPASREKTKAFIKK